jgi:hypothetical protein
MLHFFCVFHEEPKRIICVSLDKKTSTYRGQIYHNKKNYSCGFFVNKLDCAKAVNAKCVELDIPLKNPEVGLPENKPHKPPVRFFSNKPKVKPTSRVNILQQK